MLSLLDLLHLFCHFVDLVLLHGSHVCHAHGSRLLLLVIEGVDWVTLGSVGSELGLVLSSIQ